MSNIKQLFLNCSLLLRHEFNDLLHFLLKINKLIIL